MDFAPSAKGQEYLERLQAFMEERVSPAEPVYHEWRAKAGYDNHEVPPVVEELKVEARERGMWTLFRRAVSGLTNLEYAPLAEVMGRSIHIAPDATNSPALDTGNMEALHMF